MTMMIGFWGDDFDTPDERAFSNFYPAPFDDGEHHFTCSEQYFMWMKAMTFHDDSIASRLLQLPVGVNPIRYKRLGRKIVGYDDAVWKRVRRDIMLDACERKYSANKHLADILLGTEHATLVECSPFDRIWGIGLGKHDADGNIDNRWRDQSHWRGENLLGQVLAEVREKLKKE